MKDDGGPAFPLVHDENPHAFTGMSLRDYFAASIDVNGLQRIVEEEEQKELMGEAFDWEWPVQKQIEYNVRVEAILRYAYADAMLVEREREKPTVVTAASETPSIESGGA